MSGAAERGGVGGGMRVRRIGSDGDVNATGVLLRQASSSRWKIEEFYYAALDIAAAK